MLTYMNLIYNVKLLTHWPDQPMVEVNRGNKAQTTTNTGNDNTTSSL